MRWALSSVPALHQACPQTLRGTHWKHGFMNSRRYDGDIWLDRFARYLGFGRLSARLPGDIAPSYAFIGTFVLLDLVGNQGYQLATGRVPAFVHNPLYLLQLMAVIGAVYAARDIHRRYERAIDWMEIRERADNAEQFETIFPDTGKWVLFGVSAGVLMLNGLVFITPEAIYAVNGWGGILGVLIVTPFGFAPVGAEIIGTYIGIEILLPRRMNNSGIGLYFPDPENLGGMRPFGELIKHAYYYLMLGLIVFALIRYVPAIMGSYFDLAYGAPSAVVGLVFTIAWVGSILTVGYALFEFHRFMRRNKLDELQTLDRQAREYFQDPWDIHNFEIEHSGGRDLDDYTAIQTRIEHVRETKEYPATLTIWSQLVLTIFLPKAVQLGLNGLT